MTPAPFSGIVPPDDEHNRALAAVAGAAGRITDLLLTAEGLAALTQ